MSKENNKRRIRKVTAFAAALLLAASFSLPEGTEIMGVGLGSAVVASAAEVDHGNCGDGVTWSLDSDGTLTISGTGAMNDWISQWDVPWNNYNNIIKSVVIGYGVTSIGKNTFYDCTSLESITIPSGVTSIGNYAFENCSNLTGITIPDGVTYIGEGTFIGCTSLTSITIPDSVTSIREGTFMGCTSLTSITIPSSVTSIGNYAFENCSSLTSITIPDIVTSIREGTFMGCTSLTSITIPSSVNSIGNYAFYNCSNLKSIFLPERLTSIGRDAIPAAATRIKYTVSGDDVTITGAIHGSGQTSVVIPEKIGGKGVTAIGVWAFENCTSLTSITIPDSVTSIGDGAFSDCTNLTSITIPDSVTSIGDVVFSNCTNLTSITIPDSVVSIENKAFYKCTSLATVSFGENSQLTSIGNNAFNSCTSLESINIPSGVTSIGDSAFIRCSNLKSIFIPDSVTSIGTDAIPAAAAQIRYTFDTEGNATIKNVTLNNQSSVTFPTEIGGKSVKAVYIKDGTTGVEVPDSVTKVSYTVDGENVTIKKATIGSGQTSVVIPETIGGKAVTAIGDYAFGSCSSLTSITIPDSVTTVGLAAFYNCANLASVSFGENSNLETISDNAFSGCTGLTSITIPDSVTSIGNNAFKLCKSLESINIPSGVTSIDTGVFDSCSSLTSITIPKGVTSIGDEAFAGCTGLTSITIPSGVTSIGDSAFIRCSKLASIFLPDGASVGSNAIPNSATQIKYTVDVGNVKITGATAGTEQISLTIPEKIGGKAVTSIGDGAFGGCTNLVSVTLPDSITSIGDSAFIRCTSLESINIPSGVTSIGDSAFSSCPNLGSVTIPGSVTSIGTDALNCFSSITVDDSNPNYSSKNGVLFNKDGTVLIVYPINKSDDSYIIPDGVKFIEDAAFVACESLTSITIPDSVTTIGKQAFQNCGNLTSITIPGSVTSIGAEAFLGCGSLASIFLPEGPDVSYASIPTSAAQIRYTFDTEGNATIKNVDLNGQSPVTFPKEIGGEPVKAVFIEEGTTGVNAPASATGVSYTVDTDGNVTITEVTLGDGQTSFDIPSTIGGKPVTDIADNALENCPDVEHTHREKTAAACTERAVCSICGQGYGEALGHDHSGDWLNDTADHWRVCTRDNCTETLDKASHDFDKGVVTTEPTEDAEGVMTYTCETCGYKKTESIAKLNHTHNTAEEYSMDESGHWHACSGCNEKIDFEAHTKDSGTVTIQPTETSEGVRTYKCVECGYVMETETIPAVEGEHSHEYSTEWASDRTFHWHECECGEKADVSRHISDGGKVYTQPTETDSGLMVYSCIDCGYTIDAETIPALSSEHSHEYGAEWKTDSASHWHECECGEKADVSEHISDGGRITVSPTAVSEGEKTYTCTVCGYVMKTEAVPKTGTSNGHYYPIYPTFPTTSSDPGYTVSQSVFTEKLTVTTATDGDMVILSWSKIDNADKYYVYQYKNGKYVSIKSTANNSVSLKGLTNGESYQFLVRYVVDGKLSPMTYSSKFTVKVSFKPMPKAVAGKNSVKFSWKAVPGAEKYAIYKYVDGKAVKLAEVKGTSVKINKLSPDTEYSYIVSAYVDGEWTKMYKSDIVTVRTLAE